MEELKDILKDLSVCVDWISVSLTKQELYTLERIVKRLYNYEKEHKKIE